MAPAVEDSTKAASSAQACLLHGLPPTPRQCCIVSSSELGEVVGRVRYRLLNLIDSPGVVRNILLVLGVDGIHLPVCGRLREERADKELRESVQRSTQMVGADVEIAVRKTQVRFVI